MDRVTMDFETRGRIDLKTRGANVYAEDEYTDVTCCAIFAPPRPAAIWFPGWTHRILTMVTPPFPVLSDEELFEIFAQAKTIEAHNMPFERAIWEGVCTPRYGWPSIPLDKLRCSAAKCAYYAIPRALGEACKKLGLPQQKDFQGYQLMLKMCKPKGFSGETPLWHEDPAQIIRLAQYCLQDTRSEHALSEALPDIPARELQVWALDQVINNRGIQLDTKAVEDMAREISSFERSAATRIPELTGGKVNTPKQRDQILAWLREEGVEMGSLDKAAVAEALSRKNISDKAREMLELRKALGKSSTAKYESMVDRASADGRIRGSFIYHGAATGRWSGAGIQPHNMPRGSFKDVEECVSTFQDQGHRVVEVIWGDVLTAASSCLRGMLVPAPGKRLLVCDYSSIEARVNAWVAGEETTLRAFRSGLDLYKVAASGIFGVAYENVTKAQRQIGKVAILALGYQGGIAAFASMAKGYSLDLETLPQFVLVDVDPEIMDRAAANAGAYLGRDPGAMSTEAAMACDVIKQMWRIANPNIVQFWKDLEGASMKAMKDPGMIYRTGRVKFRFTHIGPRGLPFLQMRLPSGRDLHYYAPELKTMTAPWGQEKEVILIEKAMEGAGGARIRAALYGGLLCENVVQALARDLLVHGLFKVEVAGYPVVLHVHDELVAELEDGKGSLQEFETLMADVPAWATGCPVGAEGFEAKRYRK